MTLTGYAPDAIEISDEQIVQVVPPDSDVSENAPPQTTLIAIVAGSAQLTVTQTLCEGVSSCTGPTFFWQLPVQVR